MGASTSKATSTTAAADPAIMKFVGGVKLQAMRKKLMGKNLSTVSSEELLTTNANESRSVKDDAGSLTHHEKNEIKEEGHDDQTMISQRSQKAMDENGGADQTDTVDKSLAQESDGRLEKVIMNEDHEQKKHGIEKEEKEKEKEEEEEEEGVRVAAAADILNEDGRYSPGFADLPSSPSFREYCHGSIHTDSDQESVEDGKELLIDAESCEAHKSIDCATPRTADAAKKSQPSTRDRFRRLKVFSQLLNVSSCYSQQNSATQDSPQPLPTKAPS